MSEQRRVTMRFSISGGRADGRNWPQAGEDLVLPEAEAEDLVRGGMAYRHKDYEVTGSPPSAPPPPTPSPEGVVSSPAKTAAGPVEEDAPVPPAGVAPPAYAPKQAWVDYAMSLGATEDEANMQTKAQLLENYGERP